MSARLVGRKWLCKEKGQRSILVELEVHDPQKKHWYEAGDHALVFPCNSEEDVAFMMNHFTDIPDDPNLVVKLQTYQNKSGWENALTDLPPTTVRDVFRYHVSLHHTPSQELLEYLSLTAQDEEEAEHLRLLSKDQESYRDWEKQQLTVIDLFKAYPHQGCICWTVGEKVGEAGSFAYSKPDLKSKANEFLKEFYNSIGKLVFNSLKNNPCILV